MYHYLSYDRTRRIGRCSSVILLLLALLFSLQAKAASFPVTNTNDAGPGSLRQAILDANATSGGPHAIVFNVYGQITILSTLPTITSNGLTIDGQNRITINSNGTNQIINPFVINANNVAIRNFTLTNNGDIDFTVQPNTTGVTIQNITAYSNTGNFLNAFLYVAGASTNLTVRNITSTDVEPCNGSGPIVGRAFYFTGGVQTNLVIDSIHLSTAANARGCEGVVFRDASVNGLNFTHSHISGFQNGISFSNTGGPVETANNILLDHIIVDSLTTGVSIGFYSNFTNTGITIKNTLIDTRVVTSTNDFGDYGFQFNNTTDGITLDSVQLTNVDIYSIWFNGAASNININHTSINKPFVSASAGSQQIRFESTANTVGIKNTVLNGYVDGTGHDAGYGLFFVSNVAGITLDSLTVTSMDGVTGGDGIYVGGAATNFSLNHSRFTNNYDGIEFYNNAPHTNVSILNSSFQNAVRSGIVFNTTNATEQFTLTNDTVAYNASNGVWPYSGNTATNVNLTGCVIHDNGGYGVYMNNSPTNVVISQNSIYNNTGVGIGMDGTGNCSYTGANRPTLVSSTSLGGGQYQLQITIPNISVGALYNIDIYANDPGTSPASGQYYVTTLTGLSAGTSTQTITYNTGPGATGVGFWTATLRIPANSCGTSAFSGPLPIGFKGPAGVNSGIVAWYRADNGANGANWADISGNSNHMTVAGAPNLTTGLVNFNPAFYYNGSSGHLVPATAGVTGAYTLGGLGRLEGTQNARVFTSTTGNKFFGWHGGLENRLYVEAWLDNGNAITNYTKLYTFKRSTSPSAAYEFKGNGVSLMTGGATDAGVWTLAVGETNNAEYSKVFVPEVFIYNRDITPAEMQRVESYMALKYGVTLNNGATNYLATDGTVYWTADAAYNRRITGIGRDSTTLLYQKESLSSDTGIVTIALGATVAASNAANTATITADRSFLVFADNNGGTGFGTAIAGAHAKQRMTRVWKVQKTNWTDQTITLQIKGEGINNYLFIGADAGFGTFSQELRLDANGSVTLNSSLLTNGIYFTVGADIKGPAGVNTGIAMWLKADDGTATGTQWNDFSGNANAAVQPLAVCQASVLPAPVNFNPALKFDGTNDFMQAPSLMTAFGTSNLQIYAVSATDNVQIQSLFFETVSTGYPVNAHVPWTDGNIYWDAPYGYRVNAAWGGRLGAPFLWSFLRSPAGMSANRNRATVATFSGALNNIAGSNAPFDIGGAGNGINPFNGKIAEMIVYNNAGSITTTQRQQIESYLALKYGLTLSPASPVDYLASDGTPYWSASVNNTYYNHITGIGRDSITALYQKQSRSVDTGYVTIALGNALAASNAVNTAAITTDKSFFVFGDNGGATAFSTKVTGITGVNVMLARTWKVQKTNWTDQNITFVTDSTQPAAQFLVISNSPTFGAGAVVLPLANGKITLSSSQLAGGAYFTFGNALRAPGGVTAGIGAWYRGDYGLSSTQWNDYSGNGFNIPQSIAGNQPGVLASGTNFNPAANFIPPQYFGKANVVDPASSVLGAGSLNNIAVFGVTSATTGANAGGIFDQMTTNGYAVIASPSFSNTTIYWDAPYGFRQSAPWGGTIGKPNVWSFTKTITNMSVFRDHNAVINVNGTFDYGSGNGANNASNIGVWHGNGYFSGSIPELIVYKDITALSATDRQKIESYLALKYGVTLDQTVATDYLASDGTTKMWTAASNTGYGKRITGIGRDDLDSLNQKQSLSVDTGIVTIAAGTIAVSNPVNTATIANDRSFFTFSDNGASASYLTPVTGVAGVNVRMNRVWKVQKTNWADQSITLKLAGGTAQTYLLVSTDPTFATGNTAYVFADSTITINTGNLAGGIYFTFAITVKGPNAVSNGVQVWLRADDGSAGGALWKDYSRNGNDAAQGVVGGQPNTDAKALNFNYALNFNGTSDFLDIPTTRVDPNTSTIFVAGSGSGFSAVRELVSSGAVGGVGMEFRMVSTGLSYLETDGTNIGATPGSSAYVDNRPYIFSATQSNLAGGVKVYQNFRLDNQGTIALSPATANLISIGSRTISGRAFFWLGNIGEVVIYNRVLTDPERQTVDSYLSLKYGITINNGATNYLASDNTVYWTADATYKNRVTGIGRDDSTALNTKQSLSVDTGFVTLSLGSSVAVTNQQNTSVITNDKSFMVFADDGGALTYSVPVSGVNVTQRMARVWKSQKTNWADQNITLVAATPAKSMYLIVSTSASFTTLSQELPVDATGKITLSSSLLPNGSFFTFARKQLHPGGVVGASLWIRADNGTSSTTDNTAISGWNDFSSLSNNPTQATAANQPLFMNNAASNINFNPIVKFDGSSSYMTAGSEMTAFGTANLAAFAATTTDAIKTQVLFGELTSNGNYAEVMLPWSDANLYWDAPYPSARISGAWGGNLSYPYLWSFTRSTTNMTVYRNTASIITNNAAYANVAGNNSPFILGEQATGTANYFNGKIGELILYNNSVAMTATDRQRIHTYLSVKYGISMDQTTATDYLATDGTTKIWDATANAAYKYSITGIGRDDLEGLSQLQSRNSDTTRLRIAIGLGSIAAGNLANTSTFTADKNYLLWGDDNGSTTYQTAVTGATPAANFRMTRLWKTQVTGAVGAVQIAIPYNAIPNPAQAYLIVSADATLDAADNFYKLSPISINGVTYYAATVTLTSGQFFSFGANLKAPGGVGGAGLWLRPDYGTSSTTDNAAINEWLDATSQINSALQPTAANQPVYRNNTTDNVNFNPVVNFTASSSQYMNLDITKLPTGTTARTFIGMGRLNQVPATNAYLIGYGTAGTSQGSGLADVGNVGTFVGYGNDVSTAANFWQTNVFNELVGVWAGTGGNAALYSKTKQVAAPVAKAWNTGTSSGARVGNSSWSTEYWNGGMGDIIVYPFALTATQQQQVESYLAVKYGYTIDQTVATNYLASDGTTITWNATTNATYKNRITGIGRDDLTALNQLQSRNQDTTSAGWVTIGLGTVAGNNLSNANSFGTDKTFLLWGDDGIAGTSTSAVTGDGTIVLNPSNACVTFRRLGKTYKVAATGSVGSVQVLVNLTGLTLAKNAGDLYLAINGSATFNGTITKLVAATSFMNNIVEFDNVTLNDGQYFTVIGQKVFAPSNIGSGLSTWLKAESGVVFNGSTVQEWDDQAAANLNALQPAATGQPGYAASAVNFNPALTFNGTSQRMTMDGTKFPLGTSARTVIAVTSGALTASHGVISWGDQAATGNGTRYTMEIGGGQRSLEISNSRYGNTGGNTTLPGITTFTNAASSTNAATQIFVNGTTVSNALITVGNQPINTTSLPTAYLGDNVVGGGGFWYNGQLSEMLVYNRVLTAAEQQMIESYLAIKYGVTAGRDYTATGSVPTLWSVTGADAGYKNNIAGIWRLDCNDLYQKQAQSVNDPNEITIGANAIAASNAANTTLLNNESFLVWGANGTTAYTFNGTYKGTANLRLNRVWKIRDNGGVGQVQLAIPQAAITSAGALLGACDAYKLLVSNSSTDPGTAWGLSNATEYPLTAQTINGVACFVVNLGFTSNSDSYFTFARTQDVGGTPYLVADNSVKATGSSDLCEDNTWIYFLDPTDHSRRIMAIKKNGNTIDKNDFSVTIDVTTDYSNPPSSALGKAETVGSKRAIFLMRRMLQVNFTPQAGHSITTPVNVRMFRDDGSIALNEKQKALDNLNALIAAQGITVNSGPTFQWFKSGGQTISSTLSGLTPGGVPNTTGSQVWSDAADGTHTYGTDGVVPYVEFSNVTSFSTFGGAWFVNQSDGSALPVDFLSFDATKTPGGVDLTWSVAQQQNCKGYHVSRSTNGITWTRIGFVTAQSPASTNTYAFTDATPADGDNYYRIEEEDLDGRLTYSIIRKVNTGNRHFTVTAYPIPTHDVVWMNIETSQYEKAVVKIVDMQGKVLRIQEVSLQTGPNKVGSDIRNLSAGVYFLEITGTSGKWTGKIIKE